MKNRIQFILILLLSINIVASKNFPLYELENIANYRPARDNKTLFTIERSTTETFKLQKRDLKTGNLLKTYSMDLPKAFPMRMAVSKDLSSLYMLAYIKLYKVEPGLTLFHLDLKKDIVTAICAVPNKYSHVEKFLCSHNFLVIESHDLEPILVNINNRSITPLSYKNKGVPIFYDMDREGALISVKTRDTLNDLYFAPFKDQLENISQSYTKVAQFQPKFTYSTNPKKTGPYPYFLIRNRENNWIEKSFETFRYPTSQMFWADKPERRQIMDKIPNSSSIEYLDVVDSTFLMTIITMKRPYSNENDAKKKTFTIYNIKTPTQVPAIKIPIKDHKELSNLIKKERTFHHKKLSNDTIFKSKIIETKTLFPSDKKNNKTSITILAKDTVHSLTSLSQLSLHIHDDFRLNNETIQDFSKDIGSINKPRIFYSDIFAVSQNEQIWLLKRKHTFDKPTQIVTVKTNSDGKILSIHDNFDE